MKPRSKFLQPDYYLDNKSEIQGHELDVDKKIWREKDFKRADRGEGDGRERELEREREGERELERERDRVREREDRGTDRERHTQS